MATVQRQPADKAGDSISDSILITGDLQRERGRQEINANDSDRILRTGQVADSTFVQPGTIVEIQDKKGSERGKVTGFSLSIRSDGTNITTSTNITVECVK